MLDKEEMQEITKIDLVEEKEEMTIDSMVENITMVCEVVGKTKILKT